jgi:predicted lipoprotein with Yx(FWY)xxD motif
MERLFMTSKFGVQQNCMVQRITLFAWGKVAETISRNYTVWVRQVGQTQWARSKTFFASVVPDKMKNDEQLLLSLFF